MSGADPAERLQALRREFAARLPGRLTELESAIAAADWHEAGRLAHQLHGTAGSYGFAAVSDACAIIEACCGNAPAPPADPARVAVALAAARRAARAATPAG